MSDPLEANFHGHPRRNCGEHRTVGTHRAWCHDCGEWCYPTIPCQGCDVVPEDWVRVQFFPRKGYFIEEGEDDDGNEGWWVYVDDDHGAFG